MQAIEANWLLILIALIAAVAIAWYIFHAARRTRISGETRDVLDEGAAPAARNQALIDSPAGKAGEDLPRVPPATPSGMAGVGEAVEAGALAGDRQSAAPQSASTDQADDLTRIKGIGPKLAAQLQAMGVISFAQIAAWSEADIDRIDAGLGRFQGRIRRDSWVDQARYLENGDLDGFQARYGNIT